MSEQPIIKFEVALYKKDGVAYDDFFKWCTEVYPAKAIPIVKRYDIHQWTETYHPPHFREPLKDILQKLGRTEWTVAPQDVTMGYWVNSMDTMLALVADPDWHALEEEATLRANMSIGSFSIGHEKVWVTNDEIRAQSKLP